MTVESQALAFDSMTQFQDFEAQVGITPCSDRRDGRDWARVESVVVELSKALRVGDTERFLAICPEFERACQARERKPRIIDAADWIETEPLPADQVLEDMFDIGDKVAVIGSSKLRKSFFVLQLSLHLAAGLEFLGWKVPRRRKVLLVQMEVKPNHFHRRLKRMAENLGMTRAVIESHLRIVNGRGEDCSMNHIAAVARETGAEVIIFDPLYKLVTGDENNAADMKPILSAFDRLAESSGAAVMYVHHDPKGHAGDRNIRDRGAGSNVLGRDYDCCITLTPHRDDPEAIVIEVLLRNYKPQQSFSIGWCDGTFRTADLPAIAATSSNRVNQASSKPVEDYLDKALDLLKEPVSMREFADLLTTRLGLTQTKARGVQDAIIRSGKLKQTSRRYGRGGPLYIGKPADIDEMEARLRDQKLPGIDQEALLGSKSC
jgi:hypothetical protein